MTKIQWELEQKLNQLACIRLALENAEKDLQLLELQANLERFSTLPMHQLN